MSCHAGENADKTQLRRTRLIGVNGECIEMDLTRIKQEAGSESNSDIEKVVLGLDSEGEAEEGRDAAGGSCLRQSRCTFPGKIAAPWDHDDITALISVWGQERFQAELSETFRNIQVFERIAASLRRMGVQRSAVQCRGKIKKLKQEHKRCKESLARGGSEHRAFQHYQQLEREAPGSEREGSEEEEREREREKERELRETHESCLSHKCLYCSFLFSNLHTMQRHMSAKHPLLKRAGPSPGALGPPALKQACLEEEEGEEEGEGEVLTVRIKEEEQEENQTSAIGGEKQE
ncbi:UNVERIFIED_CONTAM: hypothetical protein FKN15_031842 [Acipenser sinensis]